MALITQIKDIINDAVEDVLGKNGSTISQLDTSDIVSLGKQISDYDLYEAFYGALVNRIAKTVYYDRRYAPDSREILRDEHEYGAFVQKTYTFMPEAVDNPVHNVATPATPPATGYTYSQASPYDVNTPVQVSALIFGNSGTWSLEVMRPVSQLKSAFLSEADMLGFIDSIYGAIENRMALDQEALEGAAVATAMGHAINTGLSRNLLDEYNTLNPDDELTVAQALASADFLRFASKEIKDTIDYMGRMSVLFNSKDYPTFTPSDKLVVEMLSKFENAYDVYLSADTFHDEIVALPKHKRIAFWQNIGDTSFDDTSSISIANDAFEDENASNTDAEIEQSGIICFLHDYDNVACYFGERRSWEVYNPRSNVINHGEQARKGYAVDPYMNSFVFYIAETGD